MGELGRIHQLIIPVFGYSMTFNLEVILMTWIAFLVIVALGFLTVRKRGMVPESMQVFGELLVSNLYKLTEDALDKEMAKKYGPLICALFLFLLVSNWLGIVPHLDEPTKDLNTPLSFGLMGFVIAHVAGIRKKGFKNYASEYFQPIFFMAPLNIIGEAAKIVSISFRLFGNIMGGSIIILVVSYLTYGILLPPFLYAFFGMFVGTIQAFVFTMLTVVYISVQVK
ncbi:F0F1 ATP synthase subunit A [Desulfosarcina sp.]|uniref:F0F1 ATP synthase subunit A n=1 Tax=Desulfosarcina sp. TaxID=2027861 RepID=UPI003970EFAF